MVRRLIGAIGIGVLIIAGVADYASAFNQPIFTKSSLIKPGKLYKIVSKPNHPLTLFPLPTDNPSLTGGSVSVTANDTSLTCTLAAQGYDGTEGWKGLGNPPGSKGWKYLNRLAPGGGVAGGCNRVRIRENVIKVLARDTGSLVVLDPLVNSEVAMQLDVGSDSYCALATPPHLQEVAGTLLKMEDERPFKDNGDGTITESCGRMWEKKDDAGGIHDVDNRYMWAGCCDGDCGSWPDFPGLCQPNAAAAAACSAQTGGAHGCSECSVGTCDVLRGITTIWDWLVQVNTEGGAGFAGHSDWRIPSEDGCNSCWVHDACPCDPAELESILLEPYPCGTSPCIDPIFGPTASGFYWTGSTDSSGPHCAWDVLFHDGYVCDFSKDYDGHVRAVRGGSPSAAFIDVTSGVFD